MAGSGNDRGERINSFFIKGEMAVRPHVEVEKGA